MDRKSIEAIMGISLKALMEINKFIGFISRGWGRGKENPYLGSNVILGRDDVVVVVHVIKEKGKYKVKIHECLKTSRTKLGDEVREIIKQAGLEIANP